MRYIVWLFPLLFLVSCKQKLQQTFHENGKVMEAFYADKNGVKNGTYKAFYEDGTLYEVSQYKNGKFTGMRTLYYPDGKVEIEETYIDGGILHGPYITYYKNGNIMIEKNYNNNILEGEVKAYYENGQLKESVLFKENQENGPFTEYYANGTINWKGVYLNGPNEFGLLEEYDSTGVLIKKMLCDSFAICRSTWKIENYDVKFKK